ncbi:MAG: hypothetical protein J4215_00375 [Candidatus Diapherotrites archaeon]|uniref:Uncharacterized protein n=1 Tax=Candidatus Iainarchaeum sp. TaxID=3101447 RepID=A0A8T4L641_9ARCH|nr:hypothetical protein [Candidatus Diapherotrites archaeon]
MKPRVKKPKPRLRLAKALMSAGLLAAGCAPVYSPRVIDYAAERSAFSRAKKDFGTLEGVAQKLANEKKDWGDLKKIDEFFFAVESLEENVPRLEREMQKAKKIRDRLSNPRLSSVERDREMVRFNDLVEEMRRINAKIADARFFLQELKVSRRHRTP